MNRGALRVELVGRSARRAAAGLLVVWAGPGTRAAFDDQPVAEPSGAWPEAQELIRSVAAALPTVPVLIQAQLQVRDRRGAVERVLNAEMRLDWYGQPPSAQYVIRDAFGTPREGLSLTWHKPGPPAYRYFRGEALESQELPDLYQPLEGTDISWVDLSLSFLWWPGGRTVGQERIKGRLCYVVDLPTPAQEQIPCAGVRLWIEPHIPMLLQAATYDREGAILRLMEVKSLKKIREVWVIQNLDVQSFPGRHRTSLRVRQVTVAGEQLEGVEAHGGAS